MQPPSISPRLDAHSRAGSRGFTAIELMVTVAIMAILTTLAAPSFTGLMERWRVRQASEGLESTIYYARSEAIKRGGDIRIDANASGWSNGWTVNHVVGGTNTALQTVTVPANTTVSLDSNKTTISVDRWGMLSPGATPAPAARLDFTIQASAANTAHLCIAAGGRIQQTQGSTACP